MATVGSVLAVDQLGHDLLMQQSKQVSVTMVNSELAMENAEHRTPSPSQSPSATPSSSPRNKQQSRRVASGSDPGRLLTSQDGTAVASCQQGLAYLVYVSPYNGFEADHVVSGPAPVASVDFHDQWGNGVVMRVSCVNGQPRARLSAYQSSGWPGGHDE